MCCFTQSIHTLRLSIGGRTDARTDARTDGRTENIYSVFRDKLLLLGEHVYWDDNPSMEELHPPGTRVERLDPSTNMLIAGTVMDIPLHSNPNGSAVHQVLFDNGTSASIPLADMASLIPSPPILRDVISTSSTNHDATNDHITGQHYKCVHHKERHHRQPRRDQRRPFQGHPRHPMHTHHDDDQSNSHAGHARTNSHNP